jgi:hypothetical protein
MSCTSIDLKTALEVTDVTGGWYDTGIVSSGNAKGETKMVPSITFRLRNKGTVPVNDVQLMVSFWRDGTDGEWDSALVRGIGNTDLQPGASTDPIVVRSTAGFTLEGSRADFFSHALFKDVSAKIFGQRSGTLTPLGVFQLDRKILTHELPK